MMKLLGFAIAIILFFSSCSHIMHPQADEFLKQAKGQTGIDTAQTLIGMMKDSVQTAKSESGESPGLTALHDQFHALQHSMCEVSDAQTQNPTYDNAITMTKEMKTVFHRLWDYKDDASRRTLHLNLLGKRLDELRHTLQTL